MKVLEDMKELIEDELKAIRKKGTLTPAELESVHKAVETLKYIDEICCEEENDGEYSGKYSGGYSGGHSGNRSGGYSGGYNRYDRYSGFDGRMDYSGTGDYYSGAGNYTGGYSGAYPHERIYGKYSREGAKSNMMHKLEDMLTTADNERDREMIKSWIDKLTWS